MAVLGEAVDEGAEAGCVAEDGAPLLVREIGGDHDRPSFMPRADDPEEQVGGARINFFGLDMSSTLPLGVQWFTSQWSANTTLIMAFTSLAIIPAMVFFLTMEKHIVNGLAGAVKG